MADYFTRFACLFDIGTPKSATRGLERIAWICTDGRLAQMLSRGDPDA